MSPAFDTPLPPMGPLEPAPDAVESAEAAGLRYVTDAQPGIRRKRAGRHFSYIGLDGKPIHDSDTLRRIKALAIPPAWSDVWVCPTPHGHVQATGRDARGRKQYRYHPRWRAVRDGTKYGRMIAFGEALPRIRERVAHDMARQGLPREKVLATVVRLLEATLIRVGNEEYARQNRSFGLTTLRTRHVDVSGSTVRFHFRGKSGVRHDVGVRDRRLARIIRRCQDLPGHELFQYQDEDGASHTIESGDVNAYLREISGQDFTAKDFRTWYGTVLATLALRECKPADSETQAKKNILRAIEQVAERLGNTPAVCRKCYVHPAVIDSYMERATLHAHEDRVEQEPARSVCELQSEEEAVLALLRERLAREEAGRDVGNGQAAAR